MPVIALILSYQGYFFAHQRTRVHALARVYTCVYVCICNMCVCVYVCGWAGGCATNAQANTRLFSGKSII